MNIKFKIKNIFKTFILMFKEEKRVPIPIQTNTTQLLEGKVALITGGSGGIGMAIAKSFLKNSAKVVIAGRDEKKLQDCVEHLEKKNIEYISKIKYVVLDVTEVKNMTDIIRRSASFFVENRIDILVNSAGVINRAEFKNMTEKEYDYIMDINVKGTFFMCQAVGNYMIKNQVKGHILNISSASALRPAWTPYQMSKWAIRGFTLGLADTLLPYGIIVNAIAPGPVATEMLGKKEEDSIFNVNAINGRYAEPEEIANLATFMVSDMGNLIIGDTFYITGGSGVINSHK